MNPIERQGLLAHTKLPSFQKKIKQSKQIINQALNLNSCYVALSWGKDSTVMYHLAQQVKPDILGVNFTSEWRNKIDNYQEVIDTYLAKFNSNYREYNTDYQVKAKLYWEGLRDTNPVSLIGCRAEESINRRRSIRKYGLIYQYTSGPRAGFYRVFPMAYWSWLDIWSYIALHDLPYLSSYDHELNYGRDKSRTAIIHKSYHYHKHVDIILKNNGEVLKAQSPEFYKEFIETIYGD